MALSENKTDLRDKQVARNVHDPRIVLEALLTNSTDAVLLIDTTGRILPLNINAENICKIAEQETVGHLPEADACLLKAHLDMLSDLIKHDMPGRDVLVSKDVAVMQSDGKRKHFSIRTSLLNDTNNRKHSQLILVASDITSKVKLAREFRDSTAFLTGIIVVLLISKFADNWALTKPTSIDIYSNTFVWAYTVAVCTPMFAYIVWTKKPLSEFGVTLKNWKQSLVEGITITGMLLLLGTLTLLLLGVKEGKSSSDYINSDWLKFETLAYIPHAFIQEFIFRGVVLTTLLQLFRGNSLWQPLLLSNLLFSFMHLHLGVGATVISFIIGYLFCWMYLRHSNILGVSLVHIILGSSAFVFGVL